MANFYATPYTPDPFLERVRAGEFPHPKKPAEYGDPEFNTGDVFNNLGLRRALEAHHGTCAYGPGLRELLYNEACIAGDPRDTGRWVDIACAYGRLAYTVSQARADRYTGEGTPPLLTARYLERRLEDMLRGPRAYANSVEALEGKFLVVLEALEYVRDHTRASEYSRNILARWREYLRNQGLKLGTDETLAETLAGPHLDAALALALAVPYLRGFLAKELERINPPHSTR